MQALAAAGAANCPIEPGSLRFALTGSIARDADAGPIALMTPPERFHWLVSPSSTIIAAGPVHTGLTADPAVTLEHLVRTLVLR